MVGWITLKTGIVQGVSMKGTYFLGNGKFETKEMPTQELDSEEVLVKVAACGVCGTDVHIYHGEKGSAEVVPPAILGHEISGVVEAVGSKVTKVSVGDHVSVDPNIYCGHCHFCRTGKKQLCENLFAIGVNRDGGFADYCKVPQEQCFLLNDDIPFDEGAMAEPLACCIHGFDRLNMKAGDTVCVIGGGAIGLLMVQLARLSGSSAVILSEPVEARRKTGLALGADHTVDPIHENLVERIHDILGTHGVDCVIECVGNTIATDQAFNIAKRGAKLLLFSVPKTGSIYGLHMDDIYQKELTIIGSMINPDTHQRAVDMINNHRLDLRSLITHHYPHARLEEAILMQMSDKSLKVIVESGPDILP